MVRIINYAPKHRQNDSDNNPLYDENRSPNSATAEDTFDDLLAGLTRRPDVAQSDVAPPYVASPGVAPNRPTLAKLPSVEEFHFDEAAAKNMASKLAPNQKPRIKSRRPRYRTPNRDRWHLPDEQFPDEQFDERDADSWKPPQAIAAPRRSVRGLFWSLCTSILIVLGTSAAFGFVQPLNDLLPQRMGDFLSDLTGDLSASLLNRADTSADFEVAGDKPASRPPPVSPDRRPATAAVARPVSTTSITAEVRPSANSGGSGIVVEQGELPGATSEKAFQLGATVLELGKIDSAEFATSKSAATFALAPVAAAPAATADAGNEGNPPKPLLQRSAKVDPLQVMNTAPAIMPKPVTSETLPVTSTLSAAQIDRLMARGEELLQNGDIASARLLFLRVAAAGDRRGAKGVGMTYDPRVYARLPVTGLTPDREQAEIWYRKAGVDSAFTIDSNTAAETPKAQEARSPEWYADCARKYNSFEPSTGLYTAKSGGKRPCKLP